MIKTRDQLKESFRSGAIPTANDFACLIDSLAHVDDVDPLNKQIADIAARTAAIEQKVQMPATGTVDADGQWHALKSGVDSLCAFEILAQIDKTETSPYSAVTHAIAICGATGSRPSVRQAKSFNDWYWPWILGFSIAAAVVGAPPLIVVGLGDVFPSEAQKDLLPAVSTIVHNVVLVYICAGVVVLALIGIVVSLFMRNRRAVTVRWRISGNWFAPQPKYDLVIRSGCDYGSKTQKIGINCQIKRLWT